MGIGSQMWWGGADAEWTWEPAGRVKAGFIAPHEEMRMEADSRASQPKEAAVYSRGHKVYRSLYPALRLLYPQM